MENLSPEQMRANLAQFTDDWEYIERVVGRLSRDSARKAVPPSKTVEKTYEDTMAEASEAMAEAIRLARGGWTPRTPKALIWTRATGADSVNWGGRMPAFEYVEVKRAPYREPCSRCGTRADIGCKHSARGW